jgi:thioredoxin reductase
MGVRGSPRRLGLPNEDLPKVTYNLIDTEQYKGAHVAVIGGGNAGVEAAQYLGKKHYNCKVTLLIHGAVLDRCNEENRTIIEAMQKQGLVDIWYNSQVKEIHADRLVISKQEQLTDLKNEYLFVFIGAEMPQAFLMSLGIHIDKKFGESLNKTAS